MINTVLLSFIRFARVIIREVKIGELISVALSDEHTIIKSFYLELI